MKIVHILNSVSGKGNGIVCATVDLACEQAALGHQVYAISRGGEFLPLLEGRGVKHIVVNQARHPLTILKAIFKINRAIKEIQPDIVHAHMMTGVVLARILKIKNGIPLVATVHNAWQRSSFVMGLADRVIAVSGNVKETMINRGVPGKKIEVVRNGTVGSIRLNDNDAPNLFLQRPSIATVAGLYKRKGITCLIKAFALVKKEIPTAHLYIVGEGEDRPVFEADAHGSGVSDSIHFEGFQPHPKAYLRQTDVFVLASHQEPFGLVLSEARDAGCAVVGSNVDGIPEVLENGKAGQLFESGDHAALANIVIDILKNPERLSYWKAQAKTNIEWLSVRRMCQETLKVYEILT
ncbi:MAG TPA: glycosyltransferase [Rhodospirillaceae bacterium]|nr:glycosyltransferase [Rhodospirillaceae bacterium]